MAVRDRALPYLDGEVFQLDPARVVLMTRLFKRRDRYGRQRLVHLAAIDGSACGHVTARIVALPLPAPRIEPRPVEAHEIVAYIRARGWTYHPADRKPWHCGRVAVETAAEALSLELGEQRIELR